MKRFSKGTVLLGIITALLPFFFVGQAHAEETDPIYEKSKKMVYWSWVYLPIMHHMNSVPMLMEKMKSWGSISRLPKNCR